MENEMEFLPETPLPGEPLAALSADEVLGRFRSRFRRYDCPVDALTNCCFNGELTPVSLAELSHLENEHVCEVYIAKEPGMTISLSTWPDVLRFWRDRYPWETFDYYVFDASFNWCVTLTHHDEWYAYNWAP